MDEQLKQRIVGAAVLVAVAVIFVPMLVDSPRQTARGGGQVAEIPPPPRQGFNSSVIPLGEPATPMLDEQAERDRARFDPPSPAPDPPPVEAREPAPARAPSASPRASVGAWVVQLGSFANAGNARSLRDRLRAKRFAAFVESVRHDGRSVTRVYVGPELDRKRAQVLVKKLLAETRLKGMVVRYPGG